MSLRGRRAGGFAAAAMLLAGAASAATAATASAADPAPAPARLVAFSSCEQLLGYAREHIPPPVQYDPSLPMPAVAPVAAAPEADAGGDEPDFSGTNVQEAGVDEPDTVKTDGRRIFAIAGGKLVEVDGRAPQPSVLGTLRLEGQSQELLLWRDRALVIAQTYGSAPIGLPSPLPATTTPATSGPTATAALSPAYYAPTQTVLTELDLTLTGRPRIVRSLRIDGSYRAARLVDGVVRLVLTSSPRALVDEAVRPQVAGWVPSYRVRNRRTGRSATRAVSSCTQVSRPQEFSGLGLLTVLTLDLAKGLTPIDSDSILSDVGTVYGSRDALYVATQADGATSATTIHKFAARPGAAQTRYRASGAVPGTLLSQWSLSESAGVLRAASTVTPVWGGQTVSASESFVTTLAERDGRLVELGRVGGLGRGERIYAVRFIGDVGYVVTFRQMDPLYTLDLADPARPQLLGELKIPGYSAYLHPVGEDLLLGVGQDATDQGRRLGGQVSLFDVSDLRRPKRLATAPLPGWSSQVEWDHHAFLYWPRTRLAVVPSESYYTADGGERVGATGLRISRAGGLEQVGTLSHPGGDGYRGAVTRSLVIGRRLFTLSADGVLSSDLATLRDDRWMAFGD